MRIAIVAPLYRPAIGGVEMHVEQLATRLAAGHAVDVICQTHDRDLPSEERIDGVMVRRFRVLFPSENYRCAPGIARFLRNHGDDYDLVHAHNYHALPALMAAATARAPLVFTPHYHGGSESFFRDALHRPYRLLGSAIMRRAKRVIAVAPAEASLLASHFPGAAGKIVVVPNGVDAERLSAAQPFDLGESVVVLCGGRLERYKRVGDTIRALAHLDGRYVLRITGDGPAREELEELARDLGLSQRIEFLGRVDLDQLHRWFRTAAVYVTMSEIEAMPLTPLETLYAGARVVASDIPAHRGTASFAGERLTLAPLGASPEDLASAIRAAAESDPPGGSIPTWEGVVESTLAVYRDATASLPAGPDAASAPSARSDGSRVGAPSSR
jgi:glycosyltransferase involved in cell wall biosynthesis